MTEWRKHPILQFKACIEDYSWLFTGTTPAGWSLKKTWNYFIFTHRIRGHKFKRIVLTDGRPFDLLECLSCPNDRGWCVNKKMKWFQRQWWYLERPFPWPLVVGFVALTAIIVWVLLR